VLVSDCFLLLLLDILLIILLCCAWWHLDNSNSGAPGLVDVQGIAAIPVLLRWTGWNSSVNSSQRDCHMWMSPRGRGHPKVFVAVDMTVLQQVHLEASVAMYKSTPQQV